MAWHRALPVLGVALLLLFVANGATVYSLIRTWADTGSYSHGFLVVPISLYLVWRQRGVLAGLRPVPAWSGLIALAGVSVTWTLAYLVDVQVVQQLSLVAAISGLVWAIAGVRVFLALAFPLAYLLVAVPVWDVLVPYLQDMTVAVVVAAFRGLGVPVFQDGYLLVIPEGRFLIEDVCAGMRYFMGAIAVSTLFAYLNYHGNLARGAFVAVAVALAVVVNWLRVFIVVMAGHLSDMQHWLVDSHVGFGWWLFALVVVPLFWFGPALIRDTREAPAAAPPAASADGKAAGFAAPGVVAMALVLLAPALSWWSSAAPAGSGAGRAELAPIEAGGAWRGPAAPDPRSPLAGWGPAFANADATYLAAWRHGGEQVAMYLAHYAAQSEGAEVIRYDNQVYDDSRWQQITQARRRVALPGGDGLEVVETVIRPKSGEGAGLLVWHWYVVAGEAAYGRRGAKLAQILGLLRGRRDAQAVTFSTPLRPSMARARARLAGFLDGVRPELDARLRQLGG